MSYCRMTDVYVYLVWFANAIETARAAGRAEAP